MIYKSTIYFILISILVFMPITVGGEMSNKYYLIGLKILEPDPTMCIMEPNESIQHRFWEDNLINKMTTASQ